MSIVLMGSTSGSCTLQEQAVAGTTTLTLPTFNGTVGLLVSGTAVSASGTAVDFTGIPAGVRRITVMFNGVSTNGTSNMIIQLGDSGGVETTGYVNMIGNTSLASANAGTYHTNGCNVPTYTAASSNNGQIIFSNLSGNIWVFSGLLADPVNPRLVSSAGSKTLSDVLDRVRITTEGGVNTFDAGSINILYE